MARGVEILKKARSYFQQDTLKTLYNSFVYPYFTYCIEVWGNVYSTHLESLFKLQKWAIRTITSTKKRESTTPLFQKLKLLKLKEIYIYFVTLLMYKYYHFCLPEVILNLFEKNNTIHSYATRSQNSLHVPLCRGMLTSRNVRATGVKLFNYFNQQLNWDVLYVTFKFNLKKYILEHDTSSLL